MRKASLISSIFIVLGITILFGGIVGLLSWLISAGFGAWVVGLSIFIVLLYTVDGIRNGRF